MSYMQAKIPVLAVTDPNTDIGKVIVDGGFGWWCESNDSDEFAKIVKLILSNNKVENGEKAYKYVLDNYSVNVSYQIVIKHFES